MLCQFPLAWLAIGTRGKGSCLMAFFPLARTRNTTPAEGVARRETLLTYCSGRRNNVAQVRRRAGKSVPSRPIPAYDVATIC